MEKTLIAQNKRARFNYTIEETLEAGILLLGSEVKSLREGKANIGDAYADIKENELWLLGAHIAEYKGANQFNHHPRRPRKLLVHKREAKRFIGKVKVKSMTIIPLTIYFNEKNKVKVELALVKGKKTHDKRESIKERDWNRQKQREMKRGGE